MEVTRVKKLFSSATIKEFRGHKRQVHSVGWNLDGKRLASGSVDHTARVFAVERVRKFTYKRPKMLLLN
jgi:THO complex subunit 3